MNAPDREGVWHWDDGLRPDSSMHFDGEVEVYEGPNGILCVWCEDIGSGGPDIQTFTDGDHMCGHYPVEVQGGTWTFLRPL